MATQEAKGWTYTGGYPHSLHQSTIHPPRNSEVKSIFNTPHMLVSIHAAALNPVDIQMMNLPTWKMPWNALYGKEKGVGCDFSGVVKAGGRSGFQQGDEVFGITMKPFMPYGGALATMAEFNMANTVAVKKPKEWSHEKAAAISLVWLTAKACIDGVARSVEDGSKKLAILGGSSATGMYMVKQAKARGWKVVATSSGKNRDFCLNDLKADEHVDYTSQNVRDGVAKFAPDAVIDCVGGTECIGLPSSKCYLSIVGDKTGRTSMGGPYTYYDFLAPHRAALQWLRWAKGYLGLGERYDVVILGMKTEWLEEAKSTLSADDIIVDSTFAYEDAKAAFERLNSGRARGKVVVQTIP